MIKNKTFFFVDYEGLRRKTATLAYLTVPTTDQRNAELVADTVGRADRVIVNDAAGWRLA